MFKEMYHFEEPSFSLFGPYKFMFIYIMLLDLNLLILTYCLTVMTIAFISL